MDNFGLFVAFSTFLPTMIGVVGTVFMTPLVAIQAS